MRKIIIFICFMQLVNYSIAQTNNTINVDFEIDGKLSEYKLGIAKFIYKCDTTVVNIDKGKLTIPLLVFRKNATVVFYIDKYVLQFDSIPLSVNDLYPRWTVGMDEKSFDKKKFTTIKRWKKVQIVYYLQNNYGRMYTVWRYKKSSVIIK